MVHKLQKSFLQGIEEKISYLQCNLEASLCALQVHYFLKPIICQKEDALSMEQQ